MESFTQRDFLMLILGIIVSSGGYLFRFYFFERKKRKLELKKMKLDQIEKLQNVYMTKELDKLIQDGIEDCNESLLEIETNREYSHEERSIRLSTLKKKLERVNKNRESLLKAHKNIFKEIQK